MRQRMPYTSIKPFLPHALAATLVVYGLPMIVTLGLLAGGSTAPPLPVTILAGLVLCIAATAIGSWVWSHRIESREISFGELIIWSWFRRSHAEDRIEEDAERLGLDLVGMPSATSFIDLRAQPVTLKDLTLALEIKDTYTHGHSRRVERHVKRTGEELGLSAQEMETLALAAALHDVGKIRVPDKVLRKPSDLTIEERVAVEEHALVGAAMVAPIGQEALADAVRHHHERWDGRGYPDGLAGRDIPLYARIIAVCDAYDAMTSTRPYRPSLGHEYAVDVLRDETGTQFDPDIVEAFLATLPNRIPVAALALVAFPMRLLRELALPARRLGVQNLAPAAGAVGAAAVMGAALFSPVPLESPPPVAAGAPTVIAPEVQVPEPESDRVLGDRVERRRKPKPQPSPVVLAAPADALVVEEPVVEPLPETQPKPEPEPEPEPAPEPQPQPQEEPKLDKCPPGHTKATGKGHSKHDDSKFSC